MNLDELSRDQLRRMVEELLNDNVEGAKAIAAEPRQLTDREVVEGWAVVETDEFDPDARTVTPGRRRGAEYHQSPFGHFVELTEDNRTRVAISVRGDTADLAYSAAAAWVREQGERNG